MIFEKIFWGFLHEQNTSGLVGHLKRHIFFTQHFSDSQHESMTFSWQSLNTLFCFFSSPLDKSQPKPTLPRTGMSMCLCYLRPRFGGCLVSWACGAVAATTLSFAGKLEVNLTGRLPLKNRWFQWDGCLSGNCQVPAAQAACQPSPPWPLPLPHSVRGVDPLEHSLAFS